MRRHPAMLSARAAGAALTIAALLLAGCTAQPPAAAPDPEPSASDVPSTTPEPSAQAPYDGPLQFVGDELAWFVPDIPELTRLLPGAVDVTAPRDHLEVVSDGSGVVAKPSACYALAYEVQMHALGARSVDWADANSVPRMRGHLSVMQFASPKQVQTMFAALRKAGRSCAKFTYGGPAKFTQVIDLDEESDVEVLTGLVDAGDDDWQWHAFYGYAAIGNVLVQLVHPADDDDEYDSRAIAELLAATAQEAADALREKLTKNPPASTGHKRDDPDAAWSTWHVTPTSIGPIRIGDTVDDALASIPGVDVESENDGMWELESTEGATLTVRSADGKKVTALIAGAESLWGKDVVVDGAVLPSAGDVRVGDRLSDAVEAFPGGTFARVVAAGQYQYRVAARDGGVIVFALDPMDPDDADATIVGLIVLGAGAQAIPKF